MKQERATRRDCHHDRARSVHMDRDAASIARRTEQGGWILSAAVVLMVAAPMVMEAMGL